MSSLGHSTIIEVENLSKAYGFRPVLKQVNLRVERGAFVALLGPNGSGKSTLLRLICGMNKPTGGVIRVGGWDMPREAAAVRAQIGLVSHDSLLYDNLTARENLQFFARLYPDVADERIDVLLEQVGLKKRAYSLVREFSRGMQQRLSIARALLHNPHVLLLDEPYTGLDQDAAAVLDDLLRDAHAQGHTILMATHQLARAADLADRVLIVHRGDVRSDAPNNYTPDSLSARYASITGMADVS